MIKKIKIICNKPWFVWLSIPAFMMMTGQSARRIKYFGYDTGLWIRFNVNKFALWFFYVILPVILLRLFDSFIFSDADVSAFANEIVNMTYFLVFYLCGVFAARRHEVWQKKNISHLLDDENEE